MAFAINQKKNRIDITVETYCRRTVYNNTKHIIINIIIVLKSQFRGNIATGVV